MFSHRFYPILDLEYSGTRRAVEIAGALGEAGCSMIEVRAKNSTGAEYFEFTRNILQAVGSNCRLVVNDRLDVALASGAAGVHLGEKDIPVAEARKIAGEEFIIGATARDPETAIDAQQNGADYIGSGAVFQTENKDDTMLIGLEGLGEVVRAVTIPVFAIAGITSDNCASITRTGAWGASGITAVAAAADPVEAWLSLENELSWAVGKK